MRQYRIFLSYIALNGLPVSKVSPNIYHELNGVSFLCFADPYRVNSLVPGNKPAVSLNVGQGLWRNPGCLHAELHFWWVNIAKKMCNSVSLYSERITSAYIMTHTPFTLGASAPLAPPPPPFSLRGSLCLGLCFALRICNIRHSQHPLWQVCLFLPDILRSLRGRFPNSLQDFFLFLKVCCKGTCFTFLCFVYFYFIPHVFCSCETVKDLPCLFQHKSDLFFIYRPIYIYFF